MCLGKYFKKRGKSKVFSNKVWVNLWQELFLNDSEKLKGISEVVLSEDTVYGFTYIMIT